MNRIFMLFAGLMGAAAVGLGAFQSHGLESMLIRRAVGPAEIAQRMEWCETALRYLFLHAVAIVALACHARHGTLLWRLATSGLIVGTLLFCGSLLAMSLAGITPLRHVAPYGGTILMISWLCVAVAGALDHGDRNRS